MTAVPEIPKAAVEAGALAFHAWPFDGEPVPPGMDWTELSESARSQVRELTGIILAAAAPEIARAAKVEALLWAEDSFANQGEHDAAEHCASLASEVR